MHPKLNHILAIFLIFSLNVYSFAQVCNGNLGENIFLDGDFGFGPENVLLPDPQIAPGYIYQASPPPNDGFYTITNSTTSWGSFAVNWANIEDNSPNPNGYMMVVNASFEPGLFYEQEVLGLCENTLYVFSVDIYNLAGGISPNLSFLLNGDVVYSSGNVPDNNQWNTYGFTFTTEPGQTSLTLALQNNAPGGIGNDIALDNITFRACGPEALILPTTIANICEDGSPIDLEATIDGNQYDTPAVQWQQSFDEGQTWVDIPGANDFTYTHTDLSGGFYYYRYLLANNPGNLLNFKCRVVSNVKIVNVVPKFYTIVDTLCEGLSFPLGNNEYFQTGIYTDSLLTTTGCDSIVTLDLTIVPDTDIDATINSNNPSCSYLQDGNIQLDTIINGVEPFSIFINNEISQEGNLVNLDSGFYQYLIVDRYGCEFETEIQLQLPPPFLLDLGDDQSVDLGETVEINPFFSEPVLAFNWQPADLIDCTNGCDDLLLTPTVSAIYQLSAISENGCEAIDSILVTVNEVRKLYIPNIFSPNGDGINDVFYLFGSEPNVQNIEELQIFDRWGGHLYEGYNLNINDASLGWDGTSKGEELQAGTYAFFAKVRFLDGKILLYEGEISLIR